MALRIRSSNDNASIRNNFFKYPYVWIFGVPHYLHLEQGTCYGLLKKFRAIKNPHLR